MRIKEYSIRLFEMIVDISPPPFFLCVKGEEIKIDWNEIKIIDIQKRTFYRSFQSKRIGSKKKKRVTRLEDERTLHHLTINESLIN